MEGMKYHLLPQLRPMLQSPRTRPRKATVGAMFAVGGMDASKGRASLPHTHAHNVEVIFHYEIKLCTKLRPPECGAED